jgi:hypothetical protein
MTTVLEGTLARTRIATAEVRARHRALKQAKPKCFLYKNKRNGDPGVVLAGRIDFREFTRYQFPDELNVSSAGMFEIRATHHLAKWIMTVPNTPTECKNVLFRVDMYGGEWRWTGLMHHWEVETRDGADYLTATFNDDKQFLQFLLCPPNPLLPVPLFQFPRDWMTAGPLIYCATGLLMLPNILRAEGHPYTLPDDPGDLDQWVEILNWSTWQIHVKVPSFFDDSSLWVFLGSRMNSIDTILAAALEDAQATMKYRRFFTDEGERPEGFLDNNFANGALGLWIDDDSGFNKESGSFFGGNAVTGLARSVVQRAVGDIEDSLAPIVDDPGLYYDEYYQSGFMGTLAGGPLYTIRDSHLNDLQSKLTHAPATAVSIVIGGDNPMVDAIADLVISATGNLIGYFLLAGFDSAGDIASDIIMPFLVGTILAWDEHKHTQRATNLGWVHLHEVYVAGAEMNVWSLSAIAVKRGGFNATDDETTNTCVIGPNTWLIPGVMCHTGQRIGTTNGAYRRATGDGTIFVAQIQRMALQGTGDGGFEFPMTVGKGKAAMSVGERNARELKSLMDRISDVGVHVVQ